MCTVSWLREPAGYQVFFNRDERPIRAPGLPPTMAETEGVRWLGPRDGEQLGTWIGVNEFGVAVALANRYEESPVSEPDGGYLSRGHLVSTMLASIDLNTLERRVDGADFSVFRPFTLMGFSPGQPVRLFAWTGAERSRDLRERSGLVLASSGADQLGAGAARERLFAEAPPTAEAYEALHRSHEPVRGPLSICMHRPEAGTVSFTRLDVAPGAAQVAYVPGPPCVTIQREVARLERRRPGFGP